MIKNFKNFSGSKCGSLLSSGLVAVLVGGYSAGAFGQRSDKDPIPQAPSISRGESAGVITQAGVGGGVSYARAGVVEVGGQVSLTSADKHLEVGASPQIGYFFADNLQISLITGFHHSKIDFTDAAGTPTTESATVGSAILEPSLHMPMDNSHFAFIGLGAGALFQEGGNSGFALAPRVGLKSLMGRSGMLTFDVQPIFAFKNDNLQTVNGTVLTVKSAYNLGVGFSVLL